MTLRDLSFITTAAVVAGGLYLLSLVGKAPALPANAAHFAVPVREQCLQCHTRSAMAALEQVCQHTAKWRDERAACVLCHAAPQSQSPAALSVRR